MKIGKLSNGDIHFIECENGIEKDGVRTIEELYSDGYKNVNEIEKPSESSVCTYQEFSNCFVQIWNEPFIDEEISDFDASQTRKE